MLQEISLKKFTLLFVIYTIASMIVYLTSSFSALSWLIGIFILLPIYFICVVCIVVVTLNNRNSRIKYYGISIVPILILQTVVILTSPASCYGWSQGKSCYSLIQSLLGKENLRSFADVPHWQMAEDIFPIALLLYLGSLVVLLATIRIQHPRH